MKKVLLRYTVAAMVLSAAVPAMAKTTLNIKGLKGSLEDNVEAYVSAIPKQDYNTSLRFQEQLEKEIRDALKALGRYNPTINFHVKEDGKNYRLTADVNPGPKTVIASSNITLEGMAKDDPDFIELVRNSGLGLGKTLNHGKYEALKSALSSLALRKGYFDARW
ncbi:uncharacterized protein YtfM precursor [Photobacterium aphoticum]|uniref:Uncharacterized protein YtfM n=1 Tax=Photobacterium aphoticum TaxID=754436 RepID=A0A090QXC3_9GAMM|nr:uncharacterized protein YtfM precursor [Photobacterium aphoticum]